ncbi:MULTISPECIES: arginase family protein [unclassified Mesorhizobium]|uniref:arginase family protein n=1 Tax=unclassified Mesorhizobium TaxID=325217 RepID=UPI000FD79F68|nr:MULTISPECIES: arginase family protein [unclassified Mesorhizobium]TGR42698.1 arginase family protein [bacterium M00.F.Ca.ET.199.01.1.1]TGU30132.1 arginase family protein [bacterium M00.F.Ca.ET.156.01.1.1]TGV84860.1 arginase family protein [Mesorhizobium sp. M00.F.Ca.ET.149.01.1.1]TGQ81178.1 arginase family protein [Mesorhizobium sp. M8A.F.Ca.ET.207.01.1.1]TGR24222.1 arginase family protein [Mesorhizobium sp. M8A.F.Ca.ET.202.01.1.1]
MKVSLILASYDSGHYHGGMGQGPDALISGGLVDALTLAGHDVTVEDIGRVGDDQEREIATGFAVCNAVSGEVRIARDRGRFPIVLAGNCLTSAGAVAGEGADAIIWADQHGDLNTPETSVYGFLDGMALSTVLGLCWRPMASAIPGFRPIDPARCVLVNARDLDPAEEKLLETLPVIRTECPGVAQATEQLKAAGANSVHMHLDLDVHDPKALQANRYVTSGGPSAEQLRHAACAMALAVPVVGITVSAYDPAFDARADVPPLVGQLLNDLLATIEGR